ncbi:MAG: hypothetical protein OXF21_02725, partial [bacterium]|nr:hypothetical protein [bacterium]
MNASLGGEHKAERATGANPIRYQRPVTRNFYIFIIVRNGEFEFGIRDIYVDTARQIMLDICLD